MVQNHLLQLLCLVANGAADRSRAPNSIRDEKVKVVRSLRRYDQEDVNRFVVSGQYATGRHQRANQSRPIGRRKESIQILRPKLSWLSGCTIDNWRWAEVPDLHARWQTPAQIRHGNLRSLQEGAARSCSIANPEAHDQNVLVIRIQPDEGISLRMQAKVPGTSFRIEPVKMDFHYGTSFGKASPEAYERLLLDAMSGRRHPVCATR